ncbi:hypothetical protein BH24CHL6_BH24CHL6_13610 [soil metagenome]
MRRGTRAFLPTLVGFLVVAVGLPLGSPGAALASSHDLVISQVYGGGGNAGAPLTHDYVELFNRGASSVSLDGLSIQYASATGTGNLGANSGQLTELSGSIAAGGYFLIQQAAGAGNGDPLPTPDLVDPTPIAMAAGAGKVALVTGTTSLGCNGGSAVCDADQLARIMDLVGYGNANFFEGSGAAPTLSNTEAALRNGDGAVDTDDNAADFTIGAPNPRNSSSGGPPVGALVVISQVYGGGGNSGATYTHDFIELFNRGSAAQSVTGWSVQYASSTGSSWNVTALSGTIEPGAYYLIQQAAGAGGTTALPTPDATGTAAMAAGAGKVALVSTTTALTGTCPTGGAIADFVGYGTAANCFEGTGPTATLSNTTAALRNGDGSVDTDDNAADFTVGAPNPRNSSSGDPGDPDPPEDLCEVDDSDLTFIWEIQGSGSETPIPGQSVITRGVVTADFTSGGASGIPANQGLRGFFMEAIEGDRDPDPQTSEGVFVFGGGGTFSGDIGDLVHVAGTAGEFSGVTQVSAAEIKVCDDTGVALPAPAQLPLPTHPDDRANTFEPLESMRVTHPELTVIEFFQVERFGEIRLSADGVLQTPTNVFLPGSTEAITLAEDNRAANIILDDGRTGQNLNRLDSPDLLPYVRAGGTLRIGDQLLDHVFVLHFGFNEWRFQPIDIDEITAELEANRTRPRPESPPSVGGNLKVASFNVLNYFDGDGQGGGFPNARGATTPSELARQTEKLVDAIVRLDADIYGLIEIENDGGEFQATRTLVDALNEHVGSQRFRFVDTGVIGTDAIKQAFIYKQATVTPTGDWAILTSAVDPRFDDTRSRPALAQTFLAKGTGERITVVVNHFKSKGQSGMTDTNDPDFDQGDGQGFWNHTRTQSAIALADWLATNPTGVQTLGTLIIGDLNAYGREDPIRALEDAGYVDQLIRYTDGPPYTFTFDGMQGTLDTALALPSLAARVTGAAAWHINADEVPAIDYQESVGGPGNARFRTPEIAAAYYDPSAFRSSDHDPVLLGLNLGRSKFPGPRR